MKFFKDSFYWFKTQSQARQLSFVLCLLLITLLAAILYYGFLAPHYAVLFNHLDSGDANKIISQLEQAKISYQLRNQGSDILIAKDLIDKTRIKLMSSGMQLSGSVGFELFDKSDFGLTDFSQKINYQRALQGELERTISSLEEVRQARVHLAIPEQHLFQQRDNPPRAAVSLQLIHPLSQQQVNSIQQLIAASVAHLHQSKVIIVDQQGNNLTNNDKDPAFNHFSTKKSIEHYLSEKVLQLLNRVFVDAEFMVKIDVRLNYDQLQRELIKPQQEGMLTHEKETQHSILSKMEKRATHQNISREKSYQLGTEKERFIRASGNIERLTISVVVPQATNQQTLKQIERLVKSVVGFDDKRGDLISIEALIKPPQKRAGQHELQEQKTAPAKPTSIGNLYVMGAGLSCFPLIFILLRLKGRQQKKRQLLLRELTQWLDAHD